MKFILLCCVAALASAAPQTLLLGPQVPQVLSYAAPEVQRTPENLLRVYKDAVKQELRKVAADIGILDEIADIVYGGDHADDLTLDDVMARLEALQQESPAQFQQVFGEIRSVVKPLNALFIAGMLFPITVPTPDGGAITIEKTKFQELKALLTELVIKGELKMDVVLQLINPFGWADLDLDTLLENIETITAEKLDLLQQILYVLFPFFNEEEALRNLQLQRSILPATAAVQPSVYSGVNYSYSYAGLPYSGLPLPTGLPYAGYPYAGLPYAGLHQYATRLPASTLPIAPYYSFPAVPTVKN